MTAVKTLRFFFCSASWPNPFVHECSASTSRYLLTKAAPSSLPSLPANSPFRTSFRHHRTRANSAALCSHGGPHRRPLFTPPPPLFTYVCGRAFCYPTRLTIWLQTDSHTSSPTQSHSPAFPALAPFPPFPPFPASPFRLAGSTVGAVALALLDSETTGALSPVGGDWREWANSR